MAMTRNALKERLARLERRSVEQVADVIAELHQRTGLSISAIIDEAENMAQYFRMHGHWPPAVVEAVEHVKPDELTIRLTWDHAGEEALPPERPEPSAVTDEANAQAALPPHEQEAHVPLESEPPAHVRDDVRPGEADDEADLEAQLAAVVAALQARRGGR